MAMSLGVMCSLGFGLFDYRLLVVSEAEPGFMSVGGECRGWPACCGRTRSHEVNEVQTACCPRHRVLVAEADAQAAAIQGFEPLDPGCGRSW